MLLPRRGAAFREGHNECSVMFAKILGRNRKSRGTEAAGPRNYPEAVPKRRGRKKEPENEVSNQIKYVAEEARSDSVAGDANMPVANDTRTLASAKS